MSDEYLVRDEAEAQFLQNYCIATAMGEDVNAVSPFFSDNLELPLLMTLYRCNMTCNLKCRVHSVTHNLMYNLWEKFSPLIAPVNWSFVQQQSADWCWFSLIRVNSFAAWFYHWLKFTRCFSHSNGSCPRVATFAASWVIRRGSSIICLTQINITTRTVSLLRRNGNLMSLCAWDR